MNALCVLWLLLATIFFVSLLVHWFVNNPPLLLNYFIRYGKSRAYKPGRFTQLECFDLPKRFFTHFYIVAVMWNGMLFAFHVRSLFWRITPPDWLERLLDAVRAPTNAFDNGAELSIVIAQLLMLLHVTIRLYECFFVSVFSNTTINVLQYAFGLVYYVIVGLTLICEGPDMRSRGAFLTIKQLLDQWRCHHVFGVIVFLWASFHHYYSHVILSRLRKDKTGHVVRTTHSIPYGDWFEFVSCPHYLAEILIYLALALTLGGCHMTWWAAVIYVLFCQCLAGILMHEYYVHHFPAYPRLRRAIIPFIF
uniref:polyprenol reductase isoform X1 n=1 Tax=Myxine glutinosa TaxID=7769 RepID=UPI00358FC3AE